MSLFQKVYCRQLQCLDFIQVKGVWSKYNVLMKIPQKEGNGKILIYWGSKILIYWGEKISHLLGT
jgi:hypothetical protein